MKKSNLWMQIIYTTYFVARGHNEFAEQHMNECQQMLLMSRHNLATCEALTIDILDGFFREQVVPDYIHNPKKWWEVIEYSNNEIHLAANRESAFHIWHAHNLSCEVNAYPESGKYAILNNSNETQTTKFYDGNGNCETITLEPCEILWR